MKKSLSFIGALWATSFLVFSCGGDEPAEAFLTVKDADGKAPAATVSFNAQAGSQKFTVESNGSWSISKAETAPWLTVNPSSGTGNKAVSISAEACAETSPRSVVLKFLLDGVEKTSFKVQQNAADAYLNIKDAENKAAGATLAFGAAAGEVSYTLESNAAWSVTGAAEWLKVEPASGSNNGTVKVSAAANTSLDSRTATLKFLMGTTEKLAVAVTQGAVAPYLNVTPLSATVSHGGGTTAITIETNVGDVKADITGDWLSKDDAASTAASLVLKVAVNTTTAQKTGKIKFSSPTQTSLTKEVNLTQTFIPAVADMLDFEFQKDGTAKDVSAKAHEISSKPNELALSTVWSDTYKRYIARFNPHNGTKYMYVDDKFTVGSVTSGFYSYDYRNDADFKAKLADGHSLEALVMFDAVSNSGEEIKPFSSMAGGGTGFIIARDGRLANLQHLGGWIFVNSEIKPAENKGVYYHIVGVWDKNKGISITYINGEEAAKVDVAGRNYVEPNTENARQFFVGGDPDGSGNCESTWKGDVGIARVYDNPLTAEDVKVLWERVRNPQ